jgi:Uncharacterised nucleotidyltransferase
MIQRATEHKISPQKELLLLCARIQINPDTAARIRTLAEEGLDWTELLVAAADNGIAPLFCQRVSSWAGDVLPPVWRDQFREEFVANVRRNLLLSAELLRILPALDGCGVRATPYKGPVLASQAHGDIALRQFADLDIIVPQAEILKAHRTLVDLAYAPVNCAGEPHASRQIPGQYAYVNKVFGTFVELHTEATLRYAPIRLDLEPLLARREVISLADSQVRTFSAEDSLVLLAVHGSKHFWDRLGWIADIAALSQNSRGLDWELGLERARSLGAERMVLLAAGLAHDLLEAPLSNRVVTRLKKDIVARSLMEAIFRQFFALHPVRFGVVSRFLFRARMCGAARNGLGYALRLAVTPTEADRNENPAASYFDPFYCVLRPLRLARLYGWRTRIPKVASAPKREVHVEVAQKLLVFAEIRHDDFVLDMLTDSGQLAILAARDYGTAGVGVVPNLQALVRAQIDAREQGVFKSVRFVERAFDEGADAAAPSRATILFVCAGALGDDGFRLRLEGAMSQGMRVVSMGDEITGWKSAIEAHVEGEQGEVTTFRLWHGAPMDRSVFDMQRSLKV